jgi:hypothetical protein
MISRLPRHLRGVQMRFALSDGYHIGGRELPGDREWGKGDPR